MILKGRLSADPQIQYNESKNLYFAHFTVAIEDRSIKKGDGYHTDFIRCLTIGKMAEVVKDHFAKGKEILVEGKMHTDQYEREGKTFYTTECHVSNIEFCGKKPETEKSENKGQATNKPLNIYKG